MKMLYRTTILASFLGLTNVYAQTSITPEKNLQNVANAQATTTENNHATRVIPKQNKIVIITGTRFSYPLVQKWIDDYNQVNPNVQIIIESRGQSDPSQYDILAEVYEQDDEIKKNREYINIARYAVLPVANSKSAFAKVYTNKGLNKELINQLFFHDMFADKEKEQTIKVPYTIYTRLQKAGAPIVFTKYFGYHQKDIKGKAIAGSDEVLLKCILRDSTSVSYLPLTLIYDHATKKQVNGLAVLPVDLNDNGKISDDEKIYDDLTKVIQRIEENDSKEIKNIPLGYLHLSIDKLNVNPEAIEFLRWIIYNGQNNLHDFGYLKPEPSHVESDKFEQFASKHKIK